MLARKITVADYQDHEIFGPRIEITRALEKLKAGNDSECIIFSIKSFAIKEQFKLRDIIGTDKRLRLMIQGLEINHAFPVQRYSWPKIHKSNFATLFVSAEATGKSYALLLYVVAKCLGAAPITEVEEQLNGEMNRLVINENLTDVTDLIGHPKYIVICSSQDNVELIHRIIDNMKDKVYGEFVPNTKRHTLTPVSRSVKLEHDLDKLAQRCFESDILIASPQVLVKCLEQGFVNFARCKKIFFDDLDVALQVQNNHVKELIKIYLIQTQTKMDMSSDETKKTCQLHMFSRKWTELVKQFLTSVFPQRTIIFNSIAEAAIYSNVRFEVEIYEKRKKDKDGIVTHVTEQLIHCGSGKLGEKIAIVCNTDAEARSIYARLTEKGLKSKLITGTDDLDQPILTGPGRIQRDSLFVISDPALEFEVEYSARKGPLNDVMHLVHASLPDDMMTFDQRFRLLHANIQNEKSGMTSTLVVETSSSFKLGKQIYDIASRSSVTMKSAKCELRNLVINQARLLCWRWATTGLCRFEKLSRNDRFGSYCLDRHAVQRDSKGIARHDGTWPKDGMVRISITHIISPSEFYFMFEGFKKNDSGEWVNYKTSGTEFMESLQRELNNLKMVKTRSIPLNKIVLGKIYAVHFPQVSRVDRVRILDEPKHTGTNSLVNQELEYNKLITVFKIDHGVCLDVYVKNLIELPRELARIPAQCHRGLHLGYKPPNNEPNWLYRSRKKFYDIISANQVQRVTAWIRLNLDDCFWFEGMLVSRKLTNIDSNEVWTVDPYEELRASDLAERTNSEPPILPASIRSETLCRWNHSKLVEASQYAFLRRDIDNSSVFLLSVHSDLTMTVRQSTYNKQLIDLEQALVDDYKGRKLLKQSYLAEGVICIADISSTQPSSELCLNRVKILALKCEEDQDIESTEPATEASAWIECLDHGDKFWIPVSCLFRATHTYIKKLPFQAIKCQVASLNKRLLDGNATPQRNQLINNIYDITWDENNQMKVLKCKINGNGQIYLYVPNDEHTHYDPLYKLLREKCQLELHEYVDDVCSETLKPDVDAPDIGVSDLRAMQVMGTILQLLRDIAEKSIAEAKLNQ